MIFLLQRFVAVVLRVILRRLPLVFIGQSFYLRVLYLFSLISHLFDRFRDSLAQIIRMVMGVLFQIKVLIQVVLLKLCCI